MESKGQERSSSSSSSSSFTDLFGSKAPQSSSSAGIFASIFPPPSKVAGRGTSSCEAIGAWQKEPFGNPAWNTKQGSPTRHVDAAIYNTFNKEQSSMFHEERAEPCHLSSSLYYGGQDMYSRPPSSTNSGSYPTFQSDRGEDDSHGNNTQDASRGNWWQGSLYY